MSKPLGIKMSCDGNVLELQAEEINKKKNKSEPVGLCLNVSTNHITARGPVTS